MATRPDLDLTPIETETTNDDEEVARFVKKHYRPAVWRSQIPLIVKVLCKGHPERLAVWLSISWLLEFYAGEGKDGFGTREIASDSGIGRNQITRYVRELDELGLLEIVGYEKMSGNNPKGLRPRPRYDINWAELERRSLVLLPEKIREHGIRHHPIITHPPEQMTLNLEMPGHSALAGTGASTPDANTPGASVSVPGVARVQDNGGTGAGQPGTDIGQRASAMPGVAHQQDRDTQQENNALESPVPTFISDPWHREVPNTGTDNGQDMSDPGIEVVQDWHSTVPLEREKERRNESESESPTHADIRLLAAETARAVVMELFQHMSVFPSAETASTPTINIPAAPLGFPELPAPVLELWSADREHVAQRDIFQLDSLAAEYDLITDGYGAYWLGQAILMAERSLESKGQRPTIPYIRAVLKRWKDEDSWGSDAENPEPGRRSGSEEQAAEETTRPPVARATLSAARNKATSRQQQPTTPMPAVEQYTRLTGQEPNAVQVDAIAQTVTDLDAWKHVITDWQAHGWNVANVADMLDRYRRQTGTQPQEERVSDMPIIMHPDLKDEERDDWLYRFRQASTPPEKRAVLEQFKSEHPLDGIEGAST
jgi:hypothetical protein